MEKNKGPTIYVEGDDGQPVPYNKEIETQKEIKIAKANNLQKTGSLELLELSTKEISKKLKHQDKAIQTIMDEMVLGRHYIEINGIDQPYLTQDGADFLARATGIAVEYEMTNETIRYEEGIVIYDYKAKGTVNGVHIGEAEASANSMEETHRKVFQEFKKETNVWVNKPNKSVFDALNTVKQKAQIRAKKKLVRNILGISAQVGQDPELADNPTANKASQQGIYRTLYKHYLMVAPDAPKKKKLKNGKWKFFTDKEQLVWRKEWVRVNILQPYLLKEGLKTHNWGIKDIEALKEVLPNLPIPGDKETKEVQNEPK